MSFLPSFSAFTDEEEAGKEKHNAFREIHEAPPMTLNTQMCDEAKAYAQQLAQNCLQSSTIITNARDRL